MNFGDILKKALPWIGAAATGNIPALVTMAAKELSDVLGVTVAETPQAMENAMLGATPEQFAALKEREYAFKERIQQMGFQHIEELGRQALEVQKTYAADTANARLTFGKDERVFWVAVAILASFLLLIILELAVCYALIRGGVQVDMGIVAAVTGLLGTITGYAAAQAQQVTNYYFGSSKGSKDSGDALREAFTNATDKLQAGNTP